jgi:hypothetical protein
MAFNDDRNLSQACLMSWCGCEAPRLLRHYRYKSSSKQMYGVEKAATKVEVMVGSQSFVTREQFFADSNHVPNISYQRPS